MAQQEQDIQESFRVERHEHNHQHNSTVTVHEHRAPTDESVKLLKEMQQQVFDSVVFRADLKNNLFDSEIFIYKAMEHGLPHYKILIVVKFNGKTFQIKHDTAPFINLVDAESWLPELMKTVELEVSRILVSAAFDTGIREEFTKMYLKGRIK